MRDVIPKRLRITLFVVTIGVVIAYAFLPWEKEEERPSTQVPDLEISAEALSAEFSSTPQEAEKKYVSKVLSLTGIIKDKTGLFGTYWVGFETKSLMPVYCEFSEDDGKKGYELCTPGDLVTVVGICERAETGEGTNAVEFIQLRHGRVVETKSKSAQEP